MYYVLLSGGSGKRLWPLSNDARPKQYLKVVNKENNSMEHCSMLQRVWEQLGEAGIAGQAVITAGSEQVELIKSQVKEARIAVEPGRRDTFAAVLLSCSWLLKNGATREDYAAIMPVDPYTEGSYFETVKKLEAVMRESGAEVGLMGARPSYPASKYGYILPEQGRTAGSKSGALRRSRTRKRLRPAERGRIVELRRILRENRGYLEAHRTYGVPEDYDALCAAYESLPKISFDYEVLEKAEHLAAVEFNGYWKDLGTWDALADQMSTDTIGNVVLDDTCENTQVINELKMPVAVMGTRDLVVVAAQDGILVADKSQTANVKAVASAFDTKPMFEERRWGTLETLDDTESQGQTTLTRKICIYDGMTSSYHYHEHRDEIWTVLRVPEN